MTTEEQLYLDIIKTIPVLRYQKDPAESIQDLYNRYPNGGEYGWYALVRNMKGFAFWDTATNTWKGMELSDGSAAFASQAEASALEAAASAVAALDSKNSSLASEQAAFNYKEAAALSASSATNSANLAGSSKLAAEAAVIDAEAAKDAAIGANDLAQAAKNDAQLSASNAETSATAAGTSEYNADQSAISAESSKNAAAYSAFQANGYSTAAESSKNAAAASAAAAGISEAAAEAAKDIAVAKGDQALISASNALTYQNEAMAARDLSETYRDSSLAAATSSQEARDKAELWANENENVAVEPGMYSAKHFMLKAEDQYLLAQAEKVAAQTARTGAETARAGAETAEANAELAESNAELAETNAEAARDAAIASAATFQATYPITVYQSRALADLGTIKNLDRLTELYMNNLNLLPYTHFMWDGNAGYKVVDGKLVKAYDMSPNSNDGTTSAGTEPYAGGLIAPNESLRIKSVAGQSYKALLSYTPLSLNETASWSIIFNIKLNKFSTLTLAGNSHFVLADNKIHVYTDSGNFVAYTDLLKIGKSNVIEIGYSNGNCTIKVNGISLSTTSISTIINLDKLTEYGTAGDNDFEVNYFHILTKKLSAYESQLLTELIRLQHPEIEGVNIGNQHWATSNYEGVVTGNGTVIPEYKYNAANSPEIIPSASSTFETDGTAWWENFLAVKAYDSVNQAMLVTSENDVFAQIYKSSNIIQNFQNNKIYHYKFDVKSNDYNGVLNIGYSRTLISTISNPAITNSYQTIEYYGTWGALFASWTNGTTLSIDNVSVKEVGWDELTTPGWCYYNNDPALGAIYGKLYNWYAVAEIAKNPPAGWRVPSEGDWIQLRDYLGGENVAGKKMKALYGAFNNSFATNESGLSLIAGGFRNLGGVFTDLGNTANIWIKQPKSLYVTSGSNLFVIYTLADSKLGLSLRLLRNSPVGEETKIVSTGRFSTDISGSIKAINIPFGYRVEQIVINSTNDLTGVELWKYDMNWNGVGNLFYGKNVDANVVKIITNTSDEVMILQDGYLGLKATGNTGDGMTIDVVLKKIQ